MRSRMLVWATLSAIALCGCRSGPTAPAGAATAKWITGFWFWNGSSADVRAAAPVDVVYAQVGSIRRAFPFNERRWSAYASIPDKLPAANEYWFVWRFDEDAPPDPEVVSELMKRVREVINEARRRNLPLAGIQLDIDSPTAGLSRYGAFLSEVRKQLPADARLSITAMLDWFRPGTAVNQVIRHVDEFIPQFYDTGEHPGDAAIAAPVDAAKWGPAFERAGKPYRIGASSFGRIRLASRDSRTGKRRIALLRANGGFTPLDLGMNPVFRLSTSRTAAQEMVLRFEATANTEIRWNSIDAGDEVEFTVPNAEAIAAAVKASRATGRNCTGVVFFRWPSYNETMAMQPDQVLRAAGATERSESESAKLQVTDKGCSAVHCSDLYLTNSEPLSAQPLRYRIESSVPLEYVVPAEGIPFKMTGPERMDLLLPSYAGRSRMYLGRAVTANRPEFRLSGVKQ